MIRLITHVMCVGFVSLMLTVPAVEAGESSAAVPLTLQQAIAAALKNNPELQSFGFELRAQSARIRQAGLRPALEAGVQFENFIGSGDYNGFSGVEATFELSKVIELGGKRSARVAAAQAGLSTLDVERQARQLDVLADVTRRFITVATRQEQLRLARSAGELAQKTVKGSEIRVNAAKSPHVELDRALIAQDRARLNERRAMATLEAARKQLAASWGESQPTMNGQAFGSIQADLYALPAVGDFAELTTRLAANPDFARFASEARLRDAELRLAATRRRSDLDVSLGVRRLQATDDQAFVASFSLPLFSGPRAESYVAEAQANRGRVDADRRAAEIKAQATLFELHRELSQAVLEADTLNRETLPRISEALKETEYAFERGRYSYLELVDAQREYLSVQSSLIEAASAAHTLRAEIERLTNAPLTGSTP